MSILSPSNLETTDYGLQGWNAVHSANMQRINDKIGEMMEDTNGSVAGTQTVIDAVELYGELYSAASQGLLVTPASTWVQWTNAVAGAVSGSGYVTADIVNDRLVVGTNGAGTFGIVASFTVSPDVACNLSIAIRKNGSEITKITKAIPMTAGEDKELVLSGILEGLVSTDYVELWLTSDVNNTTITIDNVNMCIRSDGRILAQLNSLLSVLRKTTGCGVLAG